MKYRCKKDLPIEIYDEYDMPTLEYRDIKSGTVWTRNDNANYKRCILTMKKQWNGSK